MTWVIRGCGLEELIILEQQYANATEGTWVWAGGPERGQIFFDTDPDDDPGNLQVGGLESQTIVVGMYNNDYNDDDLETNEHYPNAAERIHNFQMQYLEQVGGMIYLYQV